MCIFVGRLRYPFVIWELLLSWMVEHCIGLFFPAIVSLSRSVEAKSSFQQKIFTHIDGFFFEGFAPDFFLVPCRNFSRIPKNLLSFFLLLLLPFSYSILDDDFMIEFPITCKSHEKMVLNIILLKVCELVLHKFIGYSRY